MHLATYLNLGLALGFVSENLHAQSLTTRFDSDNGIASNMFDTRPRQDLVLTSLEMARPFLPGKPIGFTSICNAPGLGRHRVWATGAVLLQGGACAGHWLDLANPTLMAVHRPNGQGAVNFLMYAPAGARGITLQAVDLTSCTVSNPTSI